MQRDAKKCGIISILGSKDGSGTSTLALNSASLLAKTGEEKILLIDFDLNCQGDLETMAGGKWKELADIYNFVERKVPPSLIQGYLSNDDCKVSYLKVYNYQKRDNLNLLNTRDISHALNYLSGAFDTIIIDCGSILTQNHAPILIGSGKIILLTTAQVSSLNHAKRKFDLLAQGYIPSEKIQFAVNMWSDENKISRSFIAEKLPKTTIYFLKVDYDGMAKSFEKSSPAVVAAPKGEFARSLSDCLKNGLLSIQKRDFPLSEALEYDGLTLLERWIYPSGKRIEQASKIPTAKKEPEEIIPDEETKQADLSWIELKENIISQLFKVTDLKKIDLSAQKGLREKLTKNTTEAILKTINEIGEEKVPQGKRKQLVEEVLNEALGLGPLETLMAEKSTTEIMINSKDQIYIERSGKLKLSSLRFSSDEQLYRIIERIVSPIGRRVDESTPLVDARLTDGSRVNIIIPPLALKGPTVTIRRFSENPLKVDDLIRFGALTKEMATFLKACIEAKLNIIISGGTGSGKTTLLNVLSSFIPEDDRVVTIEDAAELKLSQPHVVTLEARPPNLEGKGAITIRDLVKNALRMRPDRIVVGECRGGEALDMLQAMNTGHDGSMTTIHANTAKDAISRLETLVLFSGIELPSKAIREQIVGGIHLIVQLNRFSDGSRKISDISELTGMEGNIVTLQSIFKFQQKGIDQNRKVIGNFAAVGVVPKFYDDMQQKGIELQRDIFLP